MVELCHVQLGNFVCVYMKIICNGSFIYFVKIWLNELMNLIVLGVRCSDCCVNVSSSAYVVICTPFGGSGMSEV